MHTGYIYYAPLHTRYSFTKKALCNLHVIGIVCGGAYALNKVIYILELILRCIFFKLSYIYDVLKTSPCGHRSTQMSWKEI